MGYSRFELTEIELQFDPARLPRLAAVAAKSGLLDDEGPAQRDAEDLPPGRRALEDVLRGLFPDFWELDDDLWLQAEVTWYQGARFPEDDAWDAFAAAARALLGTSHALAQPAGTKTRARRSDPRYEGGGAKRPGTPAASGAEKRSEALRMLLSSARRGRAVVRAPNGLSA